VRLTHIGGPTVLIELDGWRLLTDPTFDAPGRAYRFGWGTGSTKLAGPAIPASELGPIDAVLLTHEHHEDNLDPAGRALLPQAGVVVTTASGAKTLGGTARGLSPWESTTLTRDGLPDLEVIATPCRHGPPLSHPLVGDVIGFFLNGLWVSGDTVLYPGVREVATRVNVDVALLHLGGVKFPVTGPLRYTMNAREGLELVRLIKPRVTIPIHYEGWKHFREGRAAIEREFAGEPLTWLPIGEPIDIQSAVGQS
jgi:L-ascorbate metabolism protein UlaG (beta-lactamase superfamily)